MQLGTRLQLLMLMWVSSVSAQVAGDTVTEKHLQPAQKALPIELEWSAPSGCPLRNDVLALLDAPPRDAERLQAKGTITASPNGFSLVLETVQAGQHGRRELAAEDCVELAEVTAALLSLALSSSARKAADKKPKAEVQVARPSGRPRNLWADLGVRGAVGALPAPTAGPLIRFAWWRKALRVEAGGFGLLAVREDGTEAPSSRYSLFSGLLSVCSLVGTGFSWGGCLSGELGVLRGRSEGFTDARASSQLWFAPTASLAFAYRNGPWAVFARPGISLPIVRPRFEIEPWGTVFQPDRVVPAAELSVSTRF